MKCLLRNTFKFFCLPLALTYFTTMNDVLLKYSLHTLEWNSDLLEVNYYHWFYLNVERSTCLEKLHSAAFLLFYYYLLLFLPFFFEPINILLQMAVVFSDNILAIDLFKECWPKPCFLQENGLLHCPSTPTNEGHRHKKTTNVWWDKRLTSLTTPTSCELLHS